MTTTSIDVERAPGSREAWLASNRQGLMEALDRVRRQIERAVDARHPADTTGAGDAFAAGFLLGGPELALDAAARCVAKMGAMP